MNEHLIETIYDAALQLESAEKRRAYLDLACEGNEMLRVKIEEMLRTEDRAEAFFGDVEPLGGVIASAESSPEEDLTEMHVTEKVGTVIDRYKLLQKIGEGGMGVVYMAEQTKPVTRKVALKIIKLGMDTKQVVARFEAERQALALMDHPNIAKVLDAGSTETGRPYFVMELVRGVPITEYCDKNKLSNQDRLELFIHVCQAIQHAHQKGVIHRDIKPPNVMVTLHDGNAVPKVIDFGIAKATNQKLTEKTLFTNYSQLIGTPAYMSPEQAEMSGLDVDTRTDVYSLGVLLYELLTSRTPFCGKELMSRGYGEMQRIIAEQEPPKPSYMLSTMQHAERLDLAKNRCMDIAALNKVFLGDLDWIVMKALEKDRTHRYETVNGLAADIRRHLNNEPVSAVAPTFSYQLQKFYRRNRKYMRMAAAVAGLLLLATTFATVQTFRAIKAKKQAQAAQQTLKEDLYYRSVGLAYQAISGNRPAQAISLLMECPKGLRNWEWNYVQHRAYADDQPVFHQSESVYNLTVSPNGRHVAMIVGETLQLARLTAEGSLTLAQTLGSVTRPNLRIEQWIAFSSDSQYLASAGNGGMVTIWDVERGEPVKSIQASSDPVNAIAYHPSGEEIAVVSSLTYGSSEGTIRLLDVRSGLPTRKPIRSETIVFSIAYSPDGRLLAAGMVDPRTMPHFVRVLDASSGEQASPDLLGHLLPIFSLTFSPDSQWLVSGGDTTAKLWDVSTYRLEQTLSGHSMHLKSLAFTQDGKRLISAGMDREIKIWDPFKARELLSLSGHGNEISALAMTSQGLLLSSDYSGDIRFWDASLPVISKPVFKLTEHKNRVAALAFDPNNSNRLYSVAEVEGFVWDTNTGQRLDRFPAIFDLTISRDGMHIVHPASQVSTENTRKRLDTVGITLEVNDAYVVTNIFKEANPDNKMYSCADISIDEEWLAGGTSDSEVHVWKRGNSSSVRYKLLGHRAKITRVRFSPDGLYLVSLGADGEMLRWDTTHLTETQKAVQLRPASAVGIVHFGFSSDGKQLVTGDGFNGILVLDVETGDTRLFIPNAHSGIVAVARFSPDDRWIASGGSDNLVRLWGAATGDLKETLIGHTAMVNDVAFSPDLNLLASAGWDQSILLWNLDLH